MRTVIVGCGRVGAMMAVMLDDGGHSVSILDISSAAFDRLPSSFKGSAQRGDGTDEDTLRRAGTEDADLFLALTEGDNRNIMAAQLAAEEFRVGQVIAKINDPLRALAYAELGIATICRTDLMANAILSYLKLPVAVVPGVRSSIGHHRHSDEPTRPRAGRRGRRAGRPGRGRGPDPDPRRQRPVRRAGRQRLRIEGGLSRVRPGRSAAARSATTWPRSSSSSGHEVVVMEKDRTRANQIADEIGSIVVAHDGCEGKYLAEAGCNRADVVAAVTGDDEDNLVICQMAKHHFDVPRTIARVNNPKNEELFRHLGVDELISPTRMILGSIEQDIPVHELLHLAALGSGELELIEARLQPSSPAVGRNARDIPLPEGCAIFAVIRDDVAISVRADTVLAEGDKVIAIGRTECQSALHEQLIGDAPDTIEVASAPNR